jgi:lipoprotein
VRKLVILVAAVGLFASCSKETPIAPATPKVQEQEAPVTLTGEEAGEGQIRLSLTMELDNFEQIAGGFDAAQEPRAVIPQINMGAANNKLIDLRAYADAGSDRIKGMLYVYKPNTNDIVAFNAPFRIYNDGKSIGYDGLVSGFTPGSEYERIFKKMVRNQMQDCYVTAIIGNNPGSLNFTNKGPHIINNWDDNVQLPANFVMLKSEANPIGWRHNKGGKVHEISVKNNGRMKLRMMGYLMMLRLHNGFPQYVTRMNPTTYGKSIPVYVDGNGKRYRTQRPALMAFIDLSPTLSAAQDQQLSFDPEGGKMYMDPRAVNETHFTGKHKDVVIGQPDRYRYMQYKQYVSVPVGRPAPGIVPAKGDVVVAMYFPQVDDYGAVGYQLAGPYSYDGSAFSLDPATGKYYEVKPGDDKLEKSKPIAVGSNNTYRKSRDNVVYYPVIYVQPQPRNTPANVSTSGVFNQYKNWTNGVTWEPIP